MRKVSICVWRRELDLTLHFVHQYRNIACLYAFISHCNWFILYSILAIIYDIRLFYMILFLTEAVFFFFSWMHLWFDSYIFFHVPQLLKGASSDGCSLERMPPHTKSALSSSKKERIKPNVVLMDNKSFRNHLYWPDTNTIKVLLLFSHNNESNSIKSMINLPSIYLPFISTAGTEALIDFPEHNTASHLWLVSIWLPSWLTFF